MPILIRGKSAKTDPSEDRNMNSNFERHNTKPFAGFYLEVIFIFKQIS